MARGAVDPFTLEGFFESLLLVGLPSPDSGDEVTCPLEVEYWEIIADNLSKAGWSWGCVSALNSNGRTIWIAHAHRGDGKRFVVHADDKLTAFGEMESVM